MKVNPFESCIAHGFLTNFGNSCHSLAFKNTNAKWSDFHFRLTTGCEIAPAEVWKVPANKFQYSKKS